MRLRIGLGPVVWLAAMPLALYAPFLFGGRVLYWGVYLLQFYPWRQLAADQMRAGHWPLWNPYLGAGTPLAANLQTAAFYPPNLIFLLMPVERAFGWALALHVGLAGLAAYALGRVLGLGRPGALVAGLAYGLGGYVTAHWVFPSMVYAAAYLPLLLALTVRLITACPAGAPGPTGRTRARHSVWRFVAGPQTRLAALLALAIGLQLLAGHAQTSYYSLLIAGALAATLLVRAHRGGRSWPSVAGAAGTWLAAVVWGVALAAVQLLPTAELAAYSQRGGSLADLRFAFELSFWPWRLITLAAPDFFGNPLRGEYWGYGTYWEEAAFVGVPALLLAGLAAAGWWRVRRAARAAGAPVPDGAPALHLVPALGLLAALSLWLALGSHTPLYPLLFRLVPGMALFQAPARLLIGYALAMSVLAGIGAERLAGLRVTPRQRRMLSLAILAGLGTAAAGVAARLGVPAIPASFGPSVARLGLTVALSAGLLLLRRSRLAGASRPALAAGLLSVDLLLFGWGLAPGTNPSVYHDPVPSAEFLQTQPPGRLALAYPHVRDVYDRYVSLRSFGSNDPAFLLGLRASLYPNLNAVHGLAAAGNYDPLTVGLFADLWQRIAGPQDESRPPPSDHEVLAILNLFGVRYVLSDDVLALPRLDDGPPRIYLNEAALPEAVAVPGARVIEDEQARLAALLDPAFDPRAEVLLSQPPSARPALAGGAARKPAQSEPSVARPAPDRVIVHANMARPGYLVLFDTFYPGWQATADGRPAEILAADHAFRAVYLEGGEHTVVFEYRPHSFRVGGWISLAAILLLCLAIASGYTGRALRSTWPAGPPLARAADRE